MDWKLFVTVFGSVFLAEIGDKTQLATLLYASDAKHSKWTVLLAAIVALSLAAAIGVVGGEWAGKIVAPRTLKWIAGVGFVGIGLWTIVRA
jgi:putative Ca2+/H+ antiporter (TMEM165/GDT1 family)